jgi:5-hydroxyisourate hydrolase
MAALTRDAITCHVLDTTTGRPGPNITVKLSCTTNPDIVFTCKTNEDGRIANWGNTQGIHGDVGPFVAEHGGVSATLKFMIQNYAAVEATSSCKLTAHDG